MQATPAQIVEKEQVKQEQLEVKVQQGVRKIVRIVVFYDDNSYQELQEV